MDGKAIHRCLHVLDLEKSIAFYEKALGMTEIRRMGPEDGSWTNVFMGNATSGFQLELTWNRGRTEPYDNGGRDSHLAFTVDDYEATRALHEEMGCICHVNEAMGLYFIEDPDGCWLEILPNKAEFAPQGGVDVLDAMARRRSLRRYSGEPIPQALLDRILEAGLRSASGRSRRPWELIVVRDRATLDDLTECREQGAAMLAGADAAIVVVADPTLADTWVEDCSIVMANMQLEAAASGVGAGAAVSSGTGAAQPASRARASPAARREGFLIGWAPSRRHTPRGRPGSAPPGREASQRGRPRGCPPGSRNP